MAEPILILSDDAQAYRSALLAQGLDDRPVYAVERIEALTGPSAGAPVVLAKPALLAQALPHLPNLRWAQSTFAGVDALLHPALRRDYRLTGVKGIFGPLMAEYVMAQTIAIARGFRNLNAAQQQRRWQPAPYRGLAGRRMGIAGLGSIGQRIAVAAGSFGLQVSGYRRSPGSLAGVDPVYHGPRFLEFAAPLEFLVLVLPGTDATRHLVNRRVFEVMRSDAWLINVGRGSAVDETALVEALTEGAIAGAVLDVFEQEPLPDDSPLWAMDNVIITPHVAAESFPEDIVGIFLDNLARFESDAALRYAIDFDRGY